jgi:hypothetical protein
MAQQTNYFDLKHLLDRGLPLGIILALALIGFEMFNFSTTEVALDDILGAEKFLGFHWATILAIAFCGIDFAGIARLFIPAQIDSSFSSRETWFLMGAWLLAASMNAILTWWGVSLALVNRTLASTAFIAPETLVNVVPIFVALMVWMTRILLIGSFSSAGISLFQFNTTAYPAQSINNDRSYYPEKPLQRPTARPAVTFGQATQQRPHSAPARPAAAARPVPISRPEPEYLPEVSFAQNNNYSTLNAQENRQKPQNFI